MVETCLDCGRDIEGPIARTPEGDTYHYTCIEIDYPQSCMTDDVMEVLTPEGTGEEVIEFFEYLRQNPYRPLDPEDPVGSLPEVYITVKAPVSVEVNIFRWELSLNLYHKTESINIIPWLFQSVYFGCALEREFPAFAAEDELHPRGESRIPNDPEISD